MTRKILFLIGLLVTLSHQVYADQKVTIPDDDKYWERTNDCDDSSP